MKELFAILTRGVVLISGFGIVILNLKFAGIEAQGTISLINSGILILSTISAFIGGGSIIYLLPRIAKSDLLAPSLIWVLLSTIITMAVLWLTGIEGIVHAIILGSIQSIFLIQQMILLGENRSRDYQWMLLIQSASSLIFVFIFYSISEKPDYLDFIKGIYCAFTLTLLSGFAFTSDSWKSIRFNNLPSKAYPLWKYGKYTQTGNIFHLVNQRSYLFFLEKSSAEGTVLSGIYSVVMYIAEGLWSVAKSLSAIQGAQISQNEEHLSHKLLTYKYLRFSLFSVLAGTIIVFMLPKELYDFWLQDKTKDVLDTLKFLIPGLFFNVITVIFAHYFSGKGLHKYNAWSAAGGLLGSMVLAPILIADYGLKGAAIAASTAFFIQSAVQTYLFFKAVKRHQ